MPLCTIHVTYYVIVGSPELDLRHDRLPVELELRGVEHYVARFARDVDLPIVPSVGDTIWAAQAELEVVGRRISDDGRITISTDHLWHYTEEDSDTDPLSVVDTWQQRGWRLRHGEGRWEARS